MRLITSAKGGSDSILLPVCLTICLSFCLAVEGMEVTIGGEQGCLVEVCVLPVLFWF